MLCAMIPEPSLCQNCSLEKMENVIVDVMASLKNDIKGLEPVYTSTPEACINACCVGKNISGKLFSPDRSSCLSVLMMTGRERMS